MRRLVKLTAVAGTAAAAAVLVPGVAAAAGAGQIDVCNYSSHGAYVSFPWRDHMRSSTVPSGNICVRFDFGGDGSWEQVDVVYADNPDRYIGSLGYSAPRGAEVAVYDNDQYSVRN
ncbi:hypothetical protein [Amycolatopsis sp. WQ 127309]|uniref:hypothetical protein n=1 Tax=Amycolatopsis sp. WQ 127309 TaxID=2932773 RepID=UPI001FF35110|nr:hypothetical protein [Amycolatopsis sp. WQ 127309]UOZ06898.1 hypothetical protein MUY22_00975 [Amycolatopsis sp. WQ 127309]